MGSTFVPHNFWVLVVTYQDVNLWKNGELYRFMRKNPPLPPMDRIGTTDLNGLCSLMGVTPPPVLLK